MTSENYTPEQETMINEMPVSNSKGMSRTKRCVITGISITVAVAAVYFIGPKVINKVRLMRAAKVA